MLWLSFVGGFKGGFFLRTVNFKSMCVYVCVCKKHKKRRFLMKNLAKEIDKIVQENLALGKHEIPIALIVHELLRDGFTKPTIERRLREISASFGWEICPPYLKVY